MIELVWFDLIWCDWFDLIGMDRIESDWIGLDDIITYHCAWTVNFKICLDAQLGTYQPSIPKTSQASAWSYMYIGRWMCKTEGSPTGLGKNFEGWIAEKYPWQKWSISLWKHFLVLEHRIPIWLDFVLGFSMLELESCDTCTRTEPSLRTQRTLEIESCDTCLRTEPILQTWKYHEVTKPVFLCSGSHLGMPWDLHGICETIVITIISRTTTSLTQLDVERGPAPERRKILKNPPSHQNEIAPLICRVVRAVRVRGRWAWIPGWELPLRSRFHPQPPTIVGRQPWHVWISNRIFRDLGLKNFTGRPKLHAPCEAAEKDPCGFQLVWEELALAVLGGPPRPARNTNVAWL